MGVRGDGHTNCASQLKECRLGLVLVAAAAGILGFTLAPISFLRGFTAAHRNGQPAFVCRVRIRIGCWWGSRRLLQECNRCRAGSERTV